MTEISLLTINSVGKKVILGLASGCMFSLTNENEIKMNRVKAFWIATARSPKTLIIANKGLLYLQWAWYLPYKTNLCPVLRARCVLVCPATRRHPLRRDFTPWLIYWDIFSYLGVSKGICRVHYLNYDTLIQYFRFVRGTYMTGHAIFLLLV